MNHQLFRPIRWLTDLLSRSRNLRNSVIPGFEFSVQALVLLITTPIYLIKLGTANYGVWVLVQMVLGIGVLFSPGMSEATLKYVAKHRTTGDLTRAKAAIRTSWAVNLSLGALLGGAIFLGANELARLLIPEAGPDLALAAQAFRYASIGLVIQLSAAVFEAAMLGCERFDLNSGVNLTITVALNACMTAAVLWGGGLIEMTLLSLLFLSIGALVKAFILRLRLLPGLTLLPKLDLAELREMTSFGVFSWLNSAIGKIQHDGVIIIISASLGPAALSYFTIATRILSQIQGFQRKTFGYLFPYSGRLFEEGKFQELERLFDDATLRVAVLTSAFVVPVTVFAYPLLETWIDTEAAIHATLLMQLLSLRYASVPLSIVNTNFLYGCGKVRAFTIFQTLSTLGIMTATYICTVRYGLLGVGYGQCFVLIFSVINRIVVGRILFNRTLLLPHICTTATTITPLIVLTLIWPPAIPGLIGLIFSFLLLSAVAAAFTLLLGWLRMRLLKHSNNGKAEPLAEGHTITL
ncbi:lipopolysaccharide biosynthesis protein [Cerasicoccus frondis]|uniref:lipopolysaccharide biosynthesis protein n=1 Tax=Cerasicoccus frondis TaxID=490090 RepID=UPI00285283E5|nr:lipopolysaccharide biosynthesis protein [Cerasicoccus frondis]